MESPAQLKDNTIVLFLGHFISPSFLPFIHAIFRCISFGPPFLRSVYSTWEFVDFPT